MHSLPLGVDKELIKGWKNLEYDDDQLFEIWRQVSHSYRMFVAIVKNSGLGKYLYTYVNTSDLSSIYYKPTSSFEKIALHIDYMSNYEYDQNTLYFDNLSMASQAYKELSYRRINTAYNLIFKYDKNKNRSEVVYEKIL